MTEVFVSWQDQLDFMEGNACGSGSTDYEQVRGEMHEGLRQKYGRYANFDFEVIPKAELEQFLTWLEQGDEDE